MECLETIVATITATSLMTLFSYMISNSFRELYKEPVLLEFLMSAFDFKLSDRQKTAAAWALHYLIGLHFAVLYFLPVWMETNWYEISLTSGAIFGCIIGVIGIIVWEILFKISPQHPPVKEEGYYVQLFVAHLIFGLTTATVKLLFNEM